MIETLPDFVPSPSASPNLSLNVNTDIFKIFCIVHKSNDKPKTNNSVTVHLSDLTCTL